MATGGSAMRRGLPRVAGGEPWPPAGAVTAAAAAATEGEPAESALPAESRVEAASAPAKAHEPASETAGRVGVAIRRGLPRTPGGKPWPAATAATAATAAAPAAATAAAPAESRVEAASAPAKAHEPASEVVGEVVGEAGAAVRRGLPRTPGGEPWPADVVRAAPAVAATESEVAVVPPAPEREEVPQGPRPPLTVPQSAWPGRAASHRSRGPVEQKPEPQRIGPFTKAQWAGAVIVGGIGLLFAAAMAVLAVRFLLSLDGPRDFLATYPGEYHLPDGAPVGIPAWLGWQHFFNVFLMVLIIRSGLTIRREKRPTVFWTPKNNRKGKTSLTIWFHQGLDLLWLINGAVFVVLLFVTGQWMRIVPTSWEVFPNALSAALQYVSLDWPTENGWVNYNALQQLAYFSTVFIAAPLAAITGYRMSGMWPKKNAKLNAAYPIEWARKLHFPVMLFFVVFIAIHVLLVLATGALRNLNHMYAAQGSVDPTAYADNWLGFWLFVVSLVVIAGAWIAARPLVLAPIARLFGTVSGR